MFVLTAVSSINTSRAGSSIPCSRIQRRRARATSARCRSAACSTFFERDVVSVEKTPERAAAGFDPSLAQFCNRFYQGQVRPLGDQIQNLDRELFQRRNAPAARLRGGAPLLIPALQPLYRRRHADLETLCCLASRRTGLHSCDNALPQVTRIGLRHPSPHKRRINAQRLPHSEPAGNPTDSNKPGTAFSCAQRSLAASAKGTGSPTQARRNNRWPHWSPRRSRCRRRRSRSRPTASRQRCRARRR